MTARRYIDAITTALADALESDPAVVLLGEDVTYGGPFGATKGLVDRFGEHRVRDTPISEATIMGMAVGAAATGLRPVVEVMFADFVTLAMDQLVNHAAKLHYMTGGLLRIPLTIRVQGGVGGLMGAHHSQSLESWLTHVPGLKVVAPAFPNDAETLLRSAIDDDNPVVYLEHRGLYWNRSQETARSPSGAIVRRPGTDVTLASYSKMVHSALEAAARLEVAGVSAEVVDLRWLAPLDLAALVASTAKTGRLVVAHEAVRTGGFGAEIAAEVHARAWGGLRAPIERVAAPFAPVGAARALEDAYTPGPESIVEAAMRTIEANIPQPRRRPDAP